MPERTTVSQEVESRPTEAVMANGHEVLEQRVRRLEDAVATLQDTAGQEARIVERVTRRLSSSGRALRERAAMLADSSKKFLPAVLIGSEQSVPEENAAASSRVGAWRAIQVFAAAYTEARTIVRMFFDRRYKPTWMARVVPIILLVAIFTSWYWLFFTSLPVVGTLIDKSVDLFLAFLAFKVLSWEACRYRSVLATLEGMNSGSGAETAS
jgi:hypothetical protein